MSARKLGRLAGLVFVLAAFVGGVVTTSVQSGADSSATSTEATKNIRLIDVIWE
ncbi:hypothetical protein [Actinoplanes sp. NPDC051494]|uniref:hypothetical protein n=1 Tax=Actinoplanes sp. NPDC051494 TaxID=3363907 RepID=UPI0037AC6B76